MLRGVHLLCSSDASAQSKAWVPPPPLLRLADLQPCGLWHRHALVPCTPRPAQGDCLGGHSLLHTLQQGIDPSQATHAHAWYPGQQAPSSMLAELPCPPQGIQHVACLGTAQRTWLGPPGTAVPSPRLEVSAVSGGAILLASQRHSTLESACRTPPIDILLSGRNCSCLCPCLSASVVPSASVLRLEAWLLHSDPARFEASGLQAACTALQGAPHLCTPRFWEDPAKEQAIMPPRTKQA